MNVEPRRREYNPAYFERNVKNLFGTAMRGGGEPICAGCDARFVSTGGHQLASRLRGKSFPAMPGTTVFNVLFRAICQSARAKGRSTAIGQIIPDSSARRRAQMTQYTQSVPPTRPGGTTIKRRKFYSSPATTPPCAMCFAQSNRAHVLTFPMIN